MKIKFRRYPEGDLRHDNGSADACQCQACRAKCYWVIVEEQRMP